MIRLVRNNHEIDIDKNSFFIEINEDGTKTLSFDVSVYSDIYKELFLEEQIEFEDVYYLIKEKNENGDISSIVASLDRDDLKSSIYPNYRIETMTESAMFSNVLRGTGWTVMGASNGLKRTLEAEDSNTLNILIQISNLFECYLDYDNKNKILYFSYPKTKNENGFFISEQINLKKVDYNSDSYDIVTRIYGYGKTDEDTNVPLTFASINGGKAYIEDFSYKKKVISRIIRDERFTDKQSLLDYCKSELEKYHAPVESFELDIINLSKLKPEQYSMNDYKIRDLVDYVDLKSNRRVTHRIIKITEYPFCHENDKIVLSNDPVTLEKMISSNLSSINEIEKKRATFLQQAQEEAKKVIELFAEKGHRYETENETYFLDTLPKEKAKNIMRMNLGGIAFSTNGIDGPYSTAWTIDGKFNANFITAGILQGVKIICESGLIGGMNVSKDGLSIKVPSKVQIFENEYENGYVNFKINAPSGQTNDYNILSFDFTQTNGTKYASGYLKSDIFYCMNIHADGMSADAMSVHEYLYAKSATIDSLNQSSNVSKKDDIKLFEQSGLDEIMKTDVYSYLLKCENIEGAENIPKHYGFVIGDDYNISSKILGRDKDTIDLYNALALAYKAIQEQQEQIKELAKIIKERSLK